MSEVYGEFRPLPGWSNLRSACHGCRTSFYQREVDEDGAQSNRQVLMPGDGTITRLVSAGSEERQLFVSETCPVCGDSETPGWLPGFTPPVP